MGHFQHLRGREVVLVVDKEGYRMGRFQHLRGREIFLVVDDHGLLGCQFREMFDEAKRALARRDPCREDVALPVQAQQAKASGRRDIFWAAHFVEVEREYCQIERLTNLDKLALVR